MKVRRQREECKWKVLPRNKIIYGRRKTGKTFFVRETGGWSHYYTVSREGVVYDEEMNELDYDLFLERIRHQVKETIVIDEFHRLPPKFLTFLQHASPPWILVTSTFFLAKNLLSSSSPIMGLFHPLSFSIISPVDILRELSRGMKGVELVENAIYLREPILLSFDLKVPLTRRIEAVMPMVSSLIGEIFLEERREYARGYYATLRALSGGYVLPHKATRFLKGKSFYLHVLRAMGLLKAVRVLGKKRYAYRHSSPLLDLYYYLSSKYLFEETGLFKPEVVEKLLPIHLEWFLEELLAEVLGLEPIKVFNPEVDVALARNNRLVLVAEVKWKEDLTKSDVRKIEDKLSRFRARKILVVKHPENIPDTSLEVWGPEKILGTARKHRFC